VLGLGGYAAGPAVVAARSLGIRTAILNPDAIPGRANRYLAKCADVVVLQWEQSQRHFPPNTDCRAFGCPIRKEFVTAERAEGCRQFELDPNRPTLLVTGASQGARTINRAMCHVWPEFVAQHADWQLLHLSGPRDEQESRAAYAAADVPAHVLPFTHEMHLALAAADIVVSRAGASTLAELTVLGKPSILLPYPYHRDRHQHANAQVLVDAGAAIVLEDQLDPAANAGPLLEALSRLADAGVREPMARAARGLARPNAAHDVAKWLTD
jgi:UDP-N-acetylglucosamine--N-acetylmuramyl-(pentapeptide) pyrophosphoryl-undecaprenol N-acetylglucosamine transferase